MVYVEVSKFSLELRDEMWTMNLMCQEALMDLDNWRGTWKQSIKIASHRADIWKCCPVSLPS